MMGNAHACPRCGDSRTVWTGGELVWCPRCSRGLRDVRVPDPARDRYDLVARGDWPAERARQLARKAASA